MSKATRDDVARLAGVSTAVVSYVVNNGPRVVSPETRKRVVDAIRSLDYKPNPQARAMKLGRTNTFGMIVPELDNPFHTQLIADVERRALHHKKSILLGHSHRDPEIELGMFTNMVDKGLDGLMILITLNSDEALLEHAAGVPTVLIDRVLPISGYATICSDYHQGGYLATQHLIEHGYRDIIAVHGPLSPTGGPNGRYEGYARAMTNAGLLPRPAVVTSWDVRGGYMAGVQIAKSGEPLPRAAFCFSDAVAMGFMRALNEFGISVPDQIAVVSFDGTPVAEYLWPPLTSVRQSFAALAAGAVDWLADENRPNDSHTVLPVSLEVRSSCGCKDARTGAKILAGDPA